MVSSWGRCRSVHRRRWSDRWGLLPLRQSVGPVQPGQRLHVAAMLGQQDLAVLLLELASQDAVVNLLNAGPQLLAGERGLVRLARLTALGQVLFLRRSARPPGCNCRCNSVAARSGRRREEASRPRAAAGADRAYPRP